MNSVTEKAMRRVLFAWLRRDGPRIAVAATQTFEGRAGYDRSEAEQTYRIFIARVNRNIFGNATKRFGKRLKVVPVLEGGGNTGKRYHYHSLLEVPARIDIQTYKEILNQTWIQIDGTSKHQNVWKACTSEGYLGYMLKERDKDDLLDAVDINNLWLDGAGLDAELGLLRESRSRIWTPP